jgi:hypothetical protein
MDAKIKRLAGRGKGEAVINGEIAGEWVGGGGEWLFIIFGQTLILCAICLLSFLFL